MADDFTSWRPLLFGIAYRMLGSVAEAEDAVQDVYLRWHSQAVASDSKTTARDAVAPDGLSSAATAAGLSTSAPPPIRSAKAWLVATTTRLCIDHLRSARRQREEYFGVWLPEPLVQQTASSDEPSAALADSLSTAFLLLLETLTPDERAVFLLHEAFGYSHGEIAEIVGKTEPNCRQLIRRARDHLAQGRERRRADPAQAEAVVQRFLAAVAGGDVSELLAVLAVDATLRTDGGGRVRAAPAPILGADRIARFFLGIRDNIPADAAYRFANVNGGRGVVVESAGHVIAVLTFTFEDGRIRDIFSVSNPDKLPSRSGGTAVCPV